MLIWWNFPGFGKSGNALLAAVPANRNGATPGSAFLWYLALGLLTCAIVIGITVAVRLWREIHEDEEPASNEELLAEFQQAFAAGEIDQEEFQRVTALLTGPKEGVKGDERAAVRTRTEQAGSEAQEPSARDEQGSAPDV